jgi:imidazolonepropionase-like amidohydrolase
MHPTRSRLALARSSYWFAAHDGHALDGVVAAPIAQALALRGAALWDGLGPAVRPNSCVLVRDGQVAQIGDAGDPVPPGYREIDCTGMTLIPGLIDAHVHLMFDSGPDLLTRGPALMREWLDRTRQHPVAREPIVRRAQLKLASGVTTMRILGDGYYSLALRDDLAAWNIVGPRVLTAGLHVNGPAGYVTGGLAARLDPTARAECALELTSLAGIERQLTAHIARGIDVVKIATTHGELGFADARPDLPRDWVAEIVRVAHDHGLLVTAHSYGTAGDWAAIDGGVDGIEHLVNVPHELPDDMVDAIAARGIWVTPTLAGSAHGVMTVLRDPGLLHRDDDLAAHVPAPVRRDLYLALRLLRVPGVARLLLRHRDPLGRLELWHEHTLANTAKLHRAGVNLAFGTDAPFAFGNFHHSLLTEARGLRLAGVPARDVLTMATTGSAAALGLTDGAGTLAVGGRADCVLLGSNPLDDIEALGTVRAVLKDGRLVYVNTEPPNGIN